MTVLVRAAGPTVGNLSRASSTAWLVGSNIRAERTEPESDVGWTVLVLVFLLEHTGQTPFRLCLIVVSAGPHS